MGTRVFFGILGALMATALALTFASPSQDVRVWSGAVTMVTAMIIGTPLANLVALRRWPYRSAPTLLDLERPDAVPPPARNWLLAQKDVVVRYGFELLSTIRVDRGSYTFVHLLEHAETRTIGIVSWHGRARSIMFETVIGNRRRWTTCSDSTIDLPMPDDVDLVELWGLAPEAVLGVHRALVSRSGELDPSSYRATPSATRSDPIGWLREREQRNVELLVKSGVATTNGDAMLFTWRGAGRAVFSTSWPLRLLRAFDRARHTQKVLTELHVAPTQRTKRPSATRPLVYFIGVLLFLIVVWTCTVKQ